VEPPTRLKRMPSAAVVRSCLTRPAATAAVLAAAAACAVIPSAGATRGSAEARVTCPRGVTSGAAQFSADAALAAAKRLVRIEYRQRPSDLVLIVLLARLDRQYPDLPGIAYWRELAVRRCGREVALLSWVVGAAFPERKIASPSTSISFITHTRAGWRLWYRYR